MTRYLRAATLAAAFLIGTTVTAGAQGGPPGGGPPGGGMRRAPDAMALLEKPLAGIDGLTRSPDGHADQARGGLQAEVHGHEHGDARGDDGGATGRHPARHGRDDEDA